MTHPAACARARRLSLALALAALGALFPASALAGTAGMSGNTLSFAGGSEANSVQINWFPSGWLIEDSANVAAGPGCTSIGVKKVQCPPTGVTGLSISGGDGNDSITNWAIFGPAVTLDGGAGDDTLYGAGGADTLVGGSGADQLYGSFGNDRLTGGAGADLLSGGSGSDTADYSDRTAPVTVSPNGTADDGESGEADNVNADVENAELGTGNDSFVGGDGANRVLGGDGDDQLDGAGGGDTLEGGAGKDSYYGGAGADTLRSRDTVAESVDCGGDADTALTDPDDTTSDCEQVEASTAELPPVTGDEAGDGGGAGGGSAGGGTGTGGGDSDGDGVPDASGLIEGLRLLNPANVALVITRAGTVSLRVECPADAVGGCRGTITLELVDASGRVIATRRSKPRKKKKVGRRRFNVQPGNTTTIRVRISRRGRRAINRRPGRVRLRATVDTLGADGTTTRSRRTMRVKASRRGGSAKKPPRRR